MKGNNKGEKRMSLMNRVFKRAARQTREAIMKAAVWFSETVR